MKNAPAFEVRRLRKVYPSPPVVANDGIDFKVEPGEAFGLLGPNGAGKTTLVRQLVGLLTPTSGEILLFGETVQPGGRSSRRIGRTVAYLPQGSLTLGELKSAEIIRSTAMLRGVGRRGAQSETDELLGILELEGVADRQVAKLSGGQRRLVQLAMTLVGRLPVLIFDEPTADIDPALRVRVWSLVADRTRAGASVVLVTHDVGEAEHVLDRVVMLDRGVVVASGTPSGLKSKLAHRTRLEVVVAEGSTVEPAAIVAGIEGETFVTGRRVTAWVPAEDAIRTLEKVIASAGQEAFEDVRLITPTLEDVYLEVRGRSIREQGR